MIPHTRHPWACIGLIALVPLLALPALADFSGSDSLATESSNWAELFQGSDRGALAFENSRLEFSNYKMEFEQRRAYLKWTPNKGGYDQDWFVQVYVHRGRGSVGIGVVDAEHRNKGYEVAIFRANSNDATTEPENNGFLTRNFKSKERQKSFSAATEGFLRIHYDSQAKTLTSSWKTRRDWHYFDPIHVGHWELDHSSRLTAVLIGTRWADDDDFDDPPSYQDTSGDPAATSSSSKISYFRNYKCGPASPIMDVEQPAFSDLTDGVSKRNFGTAAVGGRGVTKTFTIRNNGTAKLRNLKILRDGNHAADFSVSDPLKTVLEPGGSTTFRVTFKPKTTGTRTAAIHITSDDANKSPFDVSLSGQAVK